MKHHYVPQFLLRRWTNAGGKLQVFAVRNGGVVCNERTPEYTGYENGLYALIAAALGFPEDHLERQLFSPIDNGAAKTLEKLERHEVITPEEHRAWAIFLSSLRVRQPDVIRFLRGEGFAHLKVILAEVDAENPPPGGLSTEDWFNQNHPGRLENTSLVNWLPQMIHHDGVLETFSGLKWWLREFEPDVPALLLSDLPIHWEGGFNEAGFLIYLPVAPNRLFLGARTKETEAYLDHLPPNELVRRVNLTTLASSAERIWSSDRASALSFIEANRETLGQNVRDFASHAPWAKS